MKNKKIIVLLVIVVGFIVYYGAKFSNSYTYKVKKDGNVIVYYRNNFDNSKKGFHGLKNVRQSLVDDSISGKALLTICKEKWSGPGLDLNIKGSFNLKVAFFAKGYNFQFARLNMFDARAHDNTTPYGYRFLFNGQWIPVLYYVDRFRYNSKRRGFIKKDMNFKNIRFWCSDLKKQKVSITLDNFVIYRGDDKNPPAKIKKIEVYSSSKGIRLRWEVPHDNVFPMVYVISRAREGDSFKKIAETYHNYYIDTPPDTGNFKYRILSCDFQNNISKWSNIVNVKNTYQFKPHKINRLEKDRENYAVHVREVHKRGEGKVEKGLVVLYGDSLTGPTLYPRYVAGSLGIYIVEAYGYAGMTSGWGKTNVKSKVLSKKLPEFMLVMFGTNNVRGKLRTRDVYEKWVQDLIDIAKIAEEKGVVVVLGTIPPRGFKDMESKPEKYFNDILIEQAREYKIPVAYVFDSIQKAGDRHKFIWKDGVHWTAKGMQIAAFAWAKTMRQVEFVLRDRP